MFFFQLPHRARTAFLVCIALPVLILTITTDPDAGQTGTPQETHPTTSPAPSPDRPAPTCITFPATVTCSGN
ncbi:hypothetical protein ABZ769_35435 [Streptomyces olivoreticuli]